MKKNIQLNLNKIFKSIKDGFPTFLIYEYDKDDFLNSLTSTEKNRGNFQNMRRFFSGINTKEKEGDVWFNLYAGLDEKIDNFKNNANWWLK